MFKLTFGREDNAMAVRQIVVSDISGNPVEDDQHARIVVEDAPGVNGPVELDVSLDEAGKFQAGKIELVSLVIHEPNKAPRRVVLETKAFNSAFKGVSMDDVLAGARRAEQDAPAQRQQRRARGTGTAKPDKINYQSLENAGRPHRGRLTDAEKDVVRNNLDAVNKRLANEGLPPIDPNDPKTREKWGF